MPRLFCLAGDISQGLINIRNQEQVHYLKNVLRARRGEEFVFLDEKGNEYISRVQEASSSRVVLQVKRKRQAPGLRQLGLSVACAMAKNAKMDDIVDKLTQLGVDRVIPMITERVIVKLDPQKAALRLKRWQKIAKSSLQQCQGLHLPVIEQVKPLKDVLAEAQDYDLKLIPTLARELKSLKDIFAGRKAKKVLVLIGPEGDFSEGEVNFAKRCGFIPVSLGRTVLRVDTAAIAVASFIRLNEDY